MRVHTKTSPREKIKSYFDEEVISRINTDPVTADSRLALLLASGKLPAEFSLEPKDKTLNAKSTEAWGISSFLHHRKTNKLEGQHSPKQSCSKNDSQIQRPEFVSGFRYIKLMYSEIFTSTLKNYFPRHEKFRSELSQNKKLHTNFIYF